MRSFYTSVLYLFALHCLEKRAAYERKGVLIAAMMNANLTSETLVFTTTLSIIIRCFYLGIFFSGGSRIGCNTSCFEAEANKDVLEGLS